LSTKAIIPPQLFRWIKPLNVGSLKAQKMKKQFQLSLKRRVFCVSRYLSKTSSSLVNKTLKSHSFFASHLQESQNGARYSSSYAHAYQVNTITPINANLAIKIPIPFLPKCPALLAYPTQIALAALESVLSLDSGVITPTLK